MPTFTPTLPAPPWGMTTPPTVQLVMTIVVGALVAIAAVATLVHWRRTGSPVGILVVLGGFVCCLNESPVDILGFCFFPVDGWTVYTMFDRPIPLWVCLAYALFFGALTFVDVLLLRAGVSRRTMWLSLVGVMVVDLLIEMPTLASHLYTYYGDQPFEVGGFPLNWLVINSLGSLLASVVIVRGWSFFTGPRALLLLGVPWATYMASWVVGMPYFGTQNADVSTPVRWIGGAVSIVVGLYLIDVLFRIGLRAAPRGASAAPVTPAPAREVQGVA
jgi:hypothetical protein